MKSRNCDAWVYRRRRQDLISPSQISAFILQKMNGDRGRPISPEVDQAVITVPAYFNDAHVRPPRSRKIAGLEVLCAFINAADRCRRSLTAHKAKTGIIARL